MTSHKQPQDTHVCVVGLGYIGLPTAAVLASRGFRVTGVERNAEAVGIIEEGRAHIVEPDLDMLVRAGVQTGRLNAVTRAQEPADIIIYCLPTPITEERKPDLSILDGAVEESLSFLGPNTLAVVESTVPPGTTERIAARLREELGPACLVAHAPERVLPGRILREVVDNDRIVGGVDQESTDAAVAFYGSFVQGEILPADARLAETVKLMENAYRDVNVAFANELSMALESIGIDVWRAIELANRHPRVSILRPGAGVGGHCIAVDPYYLIDAVGEEKAPLMSAARRVNNLKPDWVAGKVRRLADRFKNPKIAVLGLTYKPDVDDLRMSPALTIARELACLDEALVVAVEPNLTRFEGLDLVSLDEALAGADIVCVLVAHTPFKRISRTMLDQTVLVDACGLFA